MPGPTPRHTLLEDACAIALGTLFIALGLTFYAQATLLVGGIAGLSLLAQFAGLGDFWVAFSLLNLPFYALSLARLGPAFTLRTLLAVSLVALLARLTPGWITLTAIHPLYAAILGGGLTGVGLLMLLRHGTGLGGLTILAAWAQERHGLRAGYVQLAFDLAILATAATLLPLDRLLWSVLSAFILNMVLAMNHRPGRYTGMS